MSTSTKLPRRIAICVCTNQWYVSSYHNIHVYSFVIRISTWFSTRFGNYGHLYWKEAQRSNFNILFSGLRAPQCKVWCSWRNILRKSRETHWKNYKFRVIMAGIIFWYVTPCGLTEYTNISGDLFSNTLIITPPHSTSSEENNSFRSF